MSPNVPQWYGVCGEEKEMKFYKRWIDEIKYGTEGFVGFLGRRLRLLFIGKCPECNSILQWNGYCYYESNLYD